MIESIELTNWKTHRHTTMRFQRGVNVLIGVMGAGKSSVMDAVSFALFGTFPALKSKSISTKELITNRPREESGAEVKLTFTVGQERYTVSRKLSRKDSSFARIEKGGSYLQTQAERVNEEISSLLKIDYDTFSRAIYAEQNRLDYFLELAKGDRKRQIDEMLGLDNFSRAEENSTSLINSLRSRVKEDEQTLAQLDVRQYRAELEKLSLEREALVAEQQRLSATAAEAKGAVKDVELKLSASKKERERRDALSKDVEVTNGRINTLKAEIAKIGERKESLERLEEMIASRKGVHEKLGKEVKELKAKEAASLKRLAQFEAELRSSEAKIAELEKVKKSLEANPLPRAAAELAKLQEELESCAGLSAVSESRIAEARTAMAELEKHLGKCPVCERVLDEEMRTRLLNDKRDAVSAEEKELKAIRLKGETLKESMKRAKERHERAVADSRKMEEHRAVGESLPKMKDSVAGERKAHDSAAAAYEKAYAQVEEASKELNDLTMRLDAARRLERYMKEVERLSDEAGRKSKELGSIKVDDKGIELLQQSLLKAGKALSEAESRTESNSRYLKSLDLQISDRAKAMAKVVQIEEKVERMRGMVSNMNKFKGALVETESALRNRLVSSINALMQDVWLQIYPYGDYPAIRLNAGKDDYTLEAATGTAEDGSAVWVDISGVASGGEKSIACLAMRISMSMVIVPNLRWLILDEPTHNIDENGIGKLVQILGESLPKIVDQVFIITHDNALRNIGGARVYSLDRDKAKNEPTSYTEV
jgi:exonuclease SbcC